MEEYRGFTLKISKTQIISISSVLVAISIIYASAENAIQCIQSKIVAPVVSEQFKIMHKPFEKTLDTINYNLSVVVEMLKIANENDPALLNKAIDRVNNTGKW